MLERRLLLVLKVLPFQQEIPALPNRIRGGNSNIRKTNMGQCNVAVIKSMDSRVPVWV